MIDQAILASAVTKISSTYQFGDSVTRVELEGMFKIHWPEKCDRKEHHSLTALFIDYKSNVDRLLLTEHQMALRARGKGRWEIVKPEDQAKYAAAVSRKGYAKTSTRALAIATNVRRSAMTDAQQREADDAAARIAGVQLMASASLRGKMCKLCRQAGHTTENCPRTM